MILQNMVETGYQQPIYIINPDCKPACGTPVFSDLTSLNKQVELAVITSPANKVAAILEDCGTHGVRHAVVLSAGFREAGKQGKKLESAIIESAHRSDVRFIGPNCLSIIRPSAGLNSSFHLAPVKKGKLALVSQSNALCTAILEWATTRDIGFSTVVSMGMSADISLGDVLDYLVADPQTHAILLYLENIEDARAFLSGLRAVARLKPVIVMKAGRHQDSYADSIFDAALRRAGVVRCMHLGDLLAAAIVLSSGLRIHGDRLAIITNSGGPAAMACDRASDFGIPLARLQEATIKALQKVLPPMWSNGNPVDILGDASADRYQQTLDLCLNDGNVDGVLVILTSKAKTNPIEVANQVIKAAANSKKAIITCWMSDGHVKAARECFVEANIPTFRLPETAIQGYAFLINYFHNQKLLLQTPSPMERHQKPDTDGVRIIIENALAEKRWVLTDMESKAILSAFHIPVTQPILARTVGDAVVHAEAIGYPVAMKIFSKEIVYKSDIGGVRLGISNAAAVQKVFYELMEIARDNLPDQDVEGVIVEPLHFAPHGRELLVAIKRDAVFGPVISFGCGGTGVEFVSDRAIALPPLNSLLARDLISRTGIANSLKPIRSLPPVNMEVVEQVLLRVSEMACELPWIQEMYINPLVADEERCTAVDARIVISHHTETQRRYAHMAIHPYPSQLINHWQLPGGTKLTIRPVRPEDAEIEQDFVRGLSNDSKYYRFLHNIKELTPEMLARFTQIDYGREMVFIAVVEEDNKEVEIGVCHYAINVDGKSCNFAIVVADKWQRHGIAHKLMEQLIECARYQGLEVMEGEVLVDNKKMSAFVESLGFRSRPLADDPSLLHISKKL